MYGKDLPEVCPNVVEFAGSQDCWNGSIGILGGDSSHPMILGLVVSKLDFALLCAPHLHLHVVIRAVPFCIPFPDLNTLTLEFRDFYVTSFRQR